MSVDGESMNELLCAKATTRLGVVASMGQAKTGVGDQALCFPLRRITTLLVSGGVGRGLSF